MFFAGCHTYLPIETPPVGAAVRVRIPVTSTVGGVVGPTSYVFLEGDVVEAGDTLVLATETMREVRFRQFVAYDTIRIAPDQRAGVDLKEFSSGRSVGLGLVLVGGIAILASTAFGGGGDRGKPGDADPSPRGAIVVTPSIISSILSLFGR